MKKKQFNLTGMRIGTLLVQEKATLPSGRGGYSCLCDCGNTKVIRTDALTQDKPVQSCGCLAREATSKRFKGKPSHSRESLIGQRFSRLFVIGDADIYVSPNGVKAAKSKCKCDCGNETIVFNASLKSGDTTSCGCFAIEQTKKRSDQLVAYNTKYTQEVYAARRVWQHCYRDGLLFDDFLELSQLDCHYCGAKPDNKYTSRDGKTKFVYNGLDRIDSSSDHRRENVVTCCMICNFAKLDRTIEDFREYIKGLRTRTLLDVEEYRKASLDISIDGLHRFLWSSVNRVLGQRYGDGDLTKEQVYRLCSMDCFYCGQKPSNRQKNCNKLARPETVEASVFIFTGLDRVDNNLPHNYENVVPCCRFCNFAKNNMSFDEFVHWVEKIKAHNA